MYCQHCTAKCNLVPCPPCCPAEHFYACVPITGAGPNLARSHPIICYGEGWMRTPWKIQAIHGKVWFNTNTRKPFPPKYDHILHKKNILYESIIIIYYLAHECDEERADIHHHHCITQRMRNLTKSKNYWMNESTNAYICKSIHHRLILLSLSLSLFNEWPLDDLCVNRCKC